MCFDCSYVCETCGEWYYDAEEHYCDPDRVSE